MRQPHAASASDPSQGQLPWLVLPHPSGARVEIFPHGAHLARWRRADGAEMIFLSDQSHFRPDIPIRGGVPVIFPQFADLGPLPKHGLLRTLPWQVVEHGAEADAVWVRLRCTDTAATREQWPHPFRAEYLVRLDDALATTLSIVNIGDRPFHFQSSLHTYHRVGDVRRVRVEGVEGVRYLERRLDEAERVEGDEPLRIRGETDRVYLRAPDRLRLHDEALERTVVVEKEGFADVVVWNPWVDKARSLEDFGNEEYTSVLCIEPANVNEPIHLDPGEEWSGMQRVRVE